MAPAAATQLPNLWDEAHAAALDEPGLLLYRSNLLGGDLRIANFGGGDASAKIVALDPLDRKPVDVLWVKGSGGDLGSMKLDGFATLCLDKLERLKGAYRGLDHEDEMVALFNHCTFNLNPRAASIDTAPHAFAPYAHVDHMHPDAVIAIAGGAGGIGSANAHRMLAEGACVVIADIDASGCDATAAELSRAYGKDAVRGVTIDVTREEAVEDAFAKAALAYGGLDIVVSNAGIASAAAIEDTSLALWNRNIDILGAGSFLTSRAAFRLMKAQGIGGSIIFIVSKNGLAASAGTSAYCAAKPLELHLARCLALEGAAFGIRVNSVNPDAALRGSKIWQGEWRDQRAQSNQVTVDELEEVHRQRSPLKLSVYPEDVAEAVYFLASDVASKSTGDIINVDAGDAVSFTR
jgi:NAD(P)-dependent dehydrogenase (short-subunit alcohol dehydrogenase family)